MQLAFYHLPSTVVTEGVFASYFSELPHVSPPNHSLLPCLFWTLGKPLFYSNVNRGPYFLAICFKSKALNLHL